VVFVGRKPEIYTTWEDAKAQVNGYPDNDHKRYSSFAEAEEALCKYHEDGYYGRTQHQPSVGASTLEREANSRCLGPVVMFFVGFVTCIVMAYVFDSE